MAEHVFDSVAFRALFPAFTSEMKYPDPQLSGYFTMATMYIHPVDWGMVEGDQLQLCLNLLAAHLAWTNGMILAGQTNVGTLTAAGIDKVTVSMTPPPTTNAWNYWLSSTPYGMQLRALLRLLSRGGGNIGGLPERDAYRNVYGIMGSGRGRLRLR